MFAGTKYDSRLEGLCGDFNGRADDDFLDLVTGKLASTPQEFGHAWRTSDSCPEIDMAVALNHDPCEVRGTYHFSDNEVDDAGDQR